MKLAEEGKTLKTRLSRCDLVLEHANHLLEYEKKGVSTISPSPSEIVSEYTEYRDQIIREEARKAADKAIMKSDAAATPKTKANAISRGLVKVGEILSESNQPSIGNNIKDDLAERLFRIKLDGFKESARKAAFKGNNKKAVDQYKEALFLITEDGRGEELSSEVEEIEEALVKLDSKE
jgi:hypothetical protein